MSKQPNNKVMESLEIAQITGKQHKNVLSDIRRILTRKGIDYRQFESSYEDANGTARPCFSLPHDLAQEILSSYKPKMVKKAKASNAKEFLMGKVEALVVESVDLQKEYDELKASYKEIVKKAVKLEEENDELTDRNQMLLAIAQNAVLLIP